MKEHLEEIASHVKRKLPVEVKSCELSSVDELVILTEAEHLHSLLIFLRDDVNCLCKILTDICGVDYPEREQRFEVVYNLLSIKNNLRITVKLPANEKEPIPSIVSLFSSALWYEREVWDMYGIKFSKNPDLRRILTDYGFDGHPLRKDFPLTGFVEMRYSEEDKKVIYEPVKLEQAYRSFDNLSPWNGADYDIKNDGEEKIA